MLLTRCAGALLHRLNHADGVARKGSSSFAEYAGLEATAPVLLMQRDPSVFVHGGNTTAAHAVTSSGGRVMVTPAQYAKAVNDLKPSAAVALNDEVPWCDAATSSLVFCVSVSLSFFLCNSVSFCDSGSSVLLFSLGQL